MRPTQRLKPPQRWASRLENSMAKRLTDVYISNYKRENLEDSFLTTYDNPLSRTTSYLYDDLEDLSFDMFPMAADLVLKDGTTVKASNIKDYDKDALKGAKLRYYYLPYFHEIYIGTTGSGKTTGCIEPQIRALGKQKNKPNLFITDPKGELFMHHSRFLKEEGYTVYILNFKDVYHSNYLNFLDEPYEEFQKLKKLPLISKEAKVKTGMPKKGEEMHAPKEQFNGKKYVFADNKAFPNPDSLEKYLAAEEFNIKARVSSLVSDISYDMIPENPGEKDRTWTDGARGLLHGIISLLLHCSIKDPQFKKDYFNIKTINDVYTLFVHGCLAKDNNYNNRETRMMDALLNYMKGDERHFIDNVITTHPSTRKGFFSTFESAMNKWMQAHIFQITSSTNIDIEHDEEHPFAIFFATRDYAKGDFEVAGIFIDYVYRAALLKADNAPKDENNNPKTRTLHFLLDEFGNIPPIPNFQTKISTARSRKIFFHLFLQSYQQLESIYSELNARIIVDNCNQEMFIGSQNFETKETFSKKCGARAVESVASTLKRGRHYDQNRIVQVSDLEELAPGEMYIKRYNSPVIKTTFIRSYILADLDFFPHYRDEKAMTEVAPTNYEGIQIKKISYSKALCYESDSVDLSVSGKLKAEFDEDDVIEKKSSTSEEIKKTTDNSAMMEEFRKLIKGSGGGNE